MKVLIACEFSGVVRDAFIRRGHNAVSCDLIPSETNGPHLLGDVTQHLNDDWDLMIAHPPCTYLSVSGLWRNHYDEERAKKTVQALEFVEILMNAPIPRICVENPVSKISTYFRKPEQTIQPYDFGEDASKRTCLWLKNLPKLQTTKRVQGRMVEWPIGSGKIVERWSNQTDSGQNKLPPSATRQQDRSRTYFGIAEAMAEQWSINE